MAISYLFGLPFWESSVIYFANVPMRFLGPFFLVEFQKYLYIQGASPLSNLYGHMSQSLNFFLREIIRYDSPDFRKLLEWLFNTFEHSSVSNLLSISTNLVDDSQLQLNRSF